MNTKQIQNKNERFRQAATNMIELLPQNNLVEHGTQMIRSASKVDQCFNALFGVTTRLQFYKTMDRIEDELDEIVFALDQVAILNHQLKVDQLDEFVKFGYDLLSIYSKACDHIIEKRFKEQQV